MIYFFGSQKLNNNEHYIFFLYLRIFYLMSNNLGQKLQNNLCSGFAKNKKLCDLG